MTTETQTLEFKSAGAVRRRFGCECGRVFETRDARVEHKCEAVPADETSDE